MRQPDYEIESKRLDETKTHIEHTIRAVENYRKKFSSNIKEAMSNLDTQESSSNYIDAMINTQFVEIAEKNYDQMVRAHKKPYFARIDFRQKDKDEIEKLYIGKTSILRDGEFTPLVIDWRAPIATLYYEGRLGENTYESEGDFYEGELSLKRQINIEDGKLIDYIDVDITTTDAFLQASLEASADERLKDIASTIQAEQNRVIRASMRKPLIVQGVAGSGKTTIALHRIAYFIYTYEKSFKPENFMILAPNRLFINYISSVLPELGVERVKQTTYIDFIEELLGKKIKLMDKNKKLIDILSNPSEDTKKSIIWHAKFKGSMNYALGIEQHLKTIEKHFTPNEHFTFDDEILAKRGEIRSLFLENYHYLPYQKRVNEIKKILTHRLKITYKAKLEQTTERYNAKIDSILAREEAGDERRTKVVTLMDERDARLVKLKHEQLHAVKNYMSLFPKYHFETIYQELIRSQELISKYWQEHLSASQISYFLSHANTIVHTGQYELEDLAALLYIKYKVHGFDEAPEVSTLVIDEAQDFSPFQFYVLKQVLKTTRFTILGDTSQGIHAYRGIDHWNEVLEGVFEGDEPQYMNLVQSYRTTVEIMNQANAVLERLGDPNTVLAKPVIRHGELPQNTWFEHEEELFNTLHKRIETLKGKGYKSIAIIGKTLQECKKIKKILDIKYQQHAKILDDKEDHYEAGLIIVPSYFAKGLEFDAVLIVTIDEDYHEHPLDIKLLYVAMTRALHHLDSLTLSPRLQILKDTL